MRYSSRGIGIGLAALLALVILFWGLAAAAAEPVAVLKLGRADQLGTVISTPQAGVVHIRAKGPSTVCLGVIDKPKADDCLLVFEAQVRSKALKGRAYLEMWCVFPSKGTFFSRGMKVFVTGDQAWTTLSTPFLLPKGISPDSVVMSLVVQGQGEVWLRNPRLVKRKAPPIK